MASRATDGKFARIYNDQESYPLISDVAEALGVIPQSVSNRACAMRQKFKAGISECELIVRQSGRRPDVPLSEDDDKFRPEFTAEDCINEIQQLAKLNPGKEMTRNFFRNEASISDATWNRYFGSFQEYTRQAGLKLTRTQHRIEAHIAKHASVDHYREANKRHDWGEEYTRDSKGRFKTMLVASDLHDQEVDPFYLRVLIDTAKRVQPDIICLAGDIFDLAEFGKYNVDPREWDIVAKIKFAHDNIFRPLREACPDVQFDLIEGNHEARLLRHLCDQTPALLAVLADLHGMTIRQILGLDKFEINYISKADLAAYSPAQMKKEIKNNYKVYYDAFVAHHFPEARNWGLAGVCGHHHKHLVWNEFSMATGSYEFHQLGGGHRLDASYCDARKWDNGFTLVNIDTFTKAVNFDYIQTSMFAVVGGKFYERMPDEIIGAYVEIMKNVESDLA